MTAPSRIPTRSITLTSSSRFGFKGSAKITGEWSAGYQMEIETRAASSEAVNQIDDDNGTRSGGTLGNEGRLLLLRQSFMYLDNKTFGNVRWGLTKTPKDDITKDTDVTDLEDTMTSDNHMNRGFFLRPKGFDTEVGGAGQLKWQAISECYSTTSAFDCSTRRNGAAYTTPTWGGFSAQAGYFEDDIWGGSLRFKNSFSPFGGGTGASKDDTWEVGAGIAYEKFRDENVQNSGGGLNGFKRDIDEWAGSASIKHNPTRLFGKNTAHWNAPVYARGVECRARVRNSRRRSDMDLAHGARYCRASLASREGAQAA